MLGKAHVESTLRATRLLERQSFEIIKHKIREFTQLL